MMNLLNRLQLPENTMKAMRYTRLDGTILGIETRCKHVGVGEMMQIGIDIEKNKYENYEMTIWVVEDGYHVGWSMLTITKDIKKIQAFTCNQGLVLPVSQDWVNSMMDTLECKIKLWENKWDDIKMES